MRMYSIMNKMLEILYNNDCLSRWFAIYHFKNSIYPSEENKKIICDYAINKLSGDTRLNAIKNRVNYNYGKKLMPNRS